MGCFRFAFEGMQGIIPFRVSAARNQSLSYPLSASIVLAFGRVANRRAAPVSSLICPSVSNKTTGFPSWLQTACNLLFNPPFVRPIHRETPPFFADWLRYGGLSSASSLSSVSSASLAQTDRQKSDWKSPSGSIGQNDYTASCTDHTPLAHHATATHDEEHKLFHWLLDGHLLALSRDSSEKRAQSGAIAQRLTSINLPWQHLFVATNAHPL